MCEKGRRQRYMWNRIKPELSGRGRKQKNLGDRQETKDTWSRGEKGDT